MRVAVVASVTVVLSACFAITPPIRFGQGVKSNDEAEHLELSRLMPTALDLDSGRFTGDVRTVKMRVWADDDYRAQNIGWQRVFQRDLDDVNEATAVLFGIRFDPEYRDWHRRAAPGAVLADAIPEIAAMDDAHEAWVVVGLTSALSSVSTTVDFLGYASEPGSYIVIRGYATGVERAAFDASFHGLDAQERDDVLEARRRHQAVTVMLHELGHTLGAPHDDASPDTIMSPAISIHAAGFPDATRTRLQAAVDRRLGRHHAGEAPALAGARRHPQVVLAVTVAGQVVFAGQPLDADTVGELLRRSRDDDPETEVVLRPAAGVTSAAVDELMKRVTASGLTRVSVQPDGTR